MAKEIIELDIPKVKALLLKVFAEEDFASIERLGGLTNHTYKVTLNDGKMYIVRIPGEGTEELIVRSDEKKSTSLACELGIDAKLLYFGDDGSKVTEYIKDAITMSADTLKEDDKLKKMSEIFIKLHNCGKNTGVPFEVFDMAAGYEEIILNNNVQMFEDYEAVKLQVMNVKKEIDSTCNVAIVPCHNDALCENWVMSDDRMYLIDWEYAGMNDGMWDLADVSIEAGFDRETDNKFLEYYLGKEPSVDDEKHFLASKLYVDYLWTLWAKTRVPFDGQPMEDWATERYERLKNNLEIFNKI